MTEPDLDLAADEPLISPDFLQGDIGRGLEAMRKRLLELSSRNRLLNFRYSKKSSLRIVDELPDQLYSQLIDGKELFFKSVPRPRRTESSFSREVLPAADHARALGIATDFDLPEKSSEASLDDGRHTDRDIQTLQYPEDLEAVLRAIHSAARLAIEETGTNMLYLVFGFLEWYESAESSQSRMAPLVLLPVTLRKAEPDTKTGMFRYAIQYSGEDLGTNITLQERLRRDCDLQLPSLSEGDTPEQYWRHCQALLVRDDRWTIRRHAALTLLSFGKLQMYRDLDPSTWPVGQSPAEHPRIREFFHGVQRDSVTFAEDYALDEPATKKTVPLVVDEADSSQHSALVDAVAGKNLVIEGPPGTGKSQTICNLIAAAMQRGKTVLFVSEKLAALEVVRHRLDGLELGEFCLELHSHKTQKRRLLDDVEARLARHRSRGAPHDLEVSVQHLTRHKELLSQYAALLNQPFTAAGRTLHDLMWSVQRRKRALTCDLDPIGRIAVESPEKLATESIADLRRSVTTFADHLSAIRQLGPLSTHPWFGVKGGSLTFIDEPTLISKLTEVRDEAARLSIEVRAANAAVGTPWIQATGSSIESAVQQLAGLPREAGGIVPRALSRLRDSALRNRLAQFLAWLDRRERISCDLTSLAGGVPTIAAGDASRIIELVEEVKRVVSVNTTAQAKSVAATLSECAKGISSGIDPTVRCLASGGITSAPSRDDISLVRSVLEIVANVQPRDLRFRTAGVTESDAVEVLAALVDHAALLKKSRAMLSARFDLDALPAVAELREMTSVTANAGVFRFLSSKYRDVKRRVKALLRADEKLSRTQLRETVRSLLDFITAKTAFEKDRNGARVGGTSFVGLDTDFEALTRIAEWRFAAGTKLRDSDRDRGPALIDRLWSMSTGELIGLQHFAPLALTTIEAVESALASAWCYLPQAECPKLLSDVSTLFEQNASRLRRAVDELNRLGFPPTMRLGDSDRLLALLAELASLEQEIESATEIRQLLQTEFDGLSADRSKVVVATLQFVYSILNCVVPESVKTWILSPEVVERIDQLSRLREQLPRLVTQVESHWIDLQQFAGIESSPWIDAEASARANWDTLFRRCSAAIEQRSLLAGWLDFVQARETVSERGLGELADLALSERVLVSELPAAFDFALENAMVKAAFRESPHLARFSGLSHEQVRNRFKTLDSQILGLARQSVARAVNARPIPAGIGQGPASSLTERHLLEREVEKQKRHIPLRQLMTRAGAALQALKPCFMMGPLSVAQYLPPGAMRFDLLIMDEASQLKPEDALGAIARADQVVVVGDRKQLPPTSFFDRLGDDQSDSEDADESSAQSLADAESILDVAAGVHRPTRLLRWHYRSRHGSLIAFSNKEFYKGELIVFPSPTARSHELGVKHIPVKDGCYENRRNLPEARQVVATALRHMAERPGESLGIVTLNSTQRELIEDLFEERLKKDPQAQEYIARYQEGLEPFFIKNLENVQGDERDVMYISVTYGRNAAGHVYQRFGPINSLTGHRRLNVLFTRARRRTVVFASMTSSDLLAEPRSSWGIRALKGYLQFAESGVLEQALFSGREPDSDFEIEVAEALRARGFDVVAQVGIAGYFVDLAVKHPRRVDAFILGIECDGATYHSAKSARDRDRLREKVLVGLGWKLHRVWSTDWFKQPNEEIDRIVKRLEELLAVSDAEIPSSRESSNEAIDQPLPVAGSDWVGEAALQPMTEAEAREQLMAFRKSASSVPLGSGELSLFRDEMIAALLRAKPRTKDDYLRRVPFELRLHTSIGEFSRYLDRVLAITSQLDR